MANEPPKESDEISDFNCAVARAVRHVNVHALPVPLQKASDDLLQLWSERYGIERPEEYRLNQE